MKKALLLFTMLMVSIGLLFAQKRQVSGTVIGEDGAPIPFATIQIKGTTTGTTADQNGQFTIEALPDAVLVVRSVGYATKEYSTGTAARLSVTLISDSENLQEVVVTAMGVQRKKNELPYSAQSVRGEDISKTRDANFVNSLSGKVSGLEIRRNNSIGGSTNIVLRGAKSLLYSNQALFVVDGVPVDNSNTNDANQTTGRGGYDFGNAAADINPDDIESLNVLKGAAAAALYGSRAANGVVMITTKKGSRGVGVTVNSGVNWGLIDESTFVKYQTKYGAGYNPVTIYESPDGFFLYRDMNGDGTRDLVVPLSEDASFGKEFDPGLMVYDWTSLTPTSANFGKPRPWVAAKNDPVTFFEDAFGTNNSVMVDGANDKGFFKLGYTRSTEKGILPNSSVKKDIINLGTSYNITPKLTAGASINFSRVRGKGRYGTGYDSKNVATNFRQWWQTNVDIKEQREAYFAERRNATWNFSSPTNLNPIYWDNNYFVRYENYENDDRFRYFGNVSLNYRITDWLDVLGRVSLDSYDEQQEERMAKGSVDVSNYSRYNRTFREYNYDLMANLNKNIGEDFSLKALAGLNIRRTTIQSVFAETNGGLVIDRLYSLANSLNAIAPPQESYSALGVDGLFASVSLGYKGFLFLDLTGRRDESSSLPEDNNVYYYPSASLGLLFSEFMKDVSWLSYGKVRANYAEVGNTAPAKSLKDTYDKPTSFDAVTLFSMPLRKNNPDLKPERTKSFEAGVELAFVDNRFGLDVTYYRQNSTDQIFPVTISSATGYDSKFVNAGDVENKGVELSAFATPIKTADFSWTLNLNWSRNRNKVLRLYEESKNLQLASFPGGVTLNAALDEPYGTIRGRNFVYNDKGQRKVDDDGYYQRTPGANEIIGNVNPDWIGGIGTTLRYKGFTLGALVDVRKGGDVFSLDMYYGLATGLVEETAGNNELGKPVRSAAADGGGVIFPGVDDDGKINDKRVTVGYGTLGYSRNPTAAFVYDASYVKLREVSLTYSFPQSLLVRTKVIKGIDLSLLGRNLWIIHKNLPYADPEDNLSSGNLQGYQVGSYPTTRNIGFNLKLRF
ncbi:SusC/RagA family TonB-linked outer membrane protein [Chitinophaga horti]|uniref:SusC/RagA family TonB-linked outer membrane protein n=1 Tax=Chitinophaga horti TaxID=2920382 RepID=A0ABY6IWU3_9BACT|nr:SusC/RagA family TonB-linked outer membrane protein [Chitinophaga horti]UYQ91853.1 SusC/RagA family TonB-linked outer membrane protein [Chitinophaga horti]